MEQNNESKAFYDGVTVGVSLHQQKVIDACKNREPLRINGELYYIQSGRKRFEEMIEKICK